jgi:hypothetical protein
MVLARVCRVSCQAWRPAAGSRSVGCCKQLEGSARLDCSSFLFSLSFLRRCMTAKLRALAAEEHNGAGLRCACCLF